MAKGVKTRRENGEGSARKLDDGQWECVIQSKLINPKTLKPKRFKRKGKSEQEARKNAQMAMNAWEKELTYNDRDVKISKTKTFGSYMEEYIDEVAIKTLTDSGYHTYTRTMSNMFYPYPIANEQLHNLSRLDFDRYYNTLGKKYSPKSCSLPIQLCRRLCDHLVERSLLKENFAKQANLEREVKDEYDKQREDDEENRKKIFTQEDIEKFYEAYKQHWGQYAVVTIFLLETGLRASEFASITNDCIDLEKRVIKINKSRAIRYKDNRDKGQGIEEYVKVPKNKKTREIYLTNLAIDCVKEMQEQTLLYCEDNKENLLYPTFRNGRRRTNATMEVGFKTLCNKLGIDRGVVRGKNGINKGLCLHSLRHTMNSYANSAKNGNSLVTSLMLGHTREVNEKIYTHSNVDILKNIQTPSKLFLEKDIEEPKNQDEEDEIKLLKYLLEKYKDRLI